MMASGRWGAWRWWWAAVVGWACVGLASIALADVTTLERLVEARRYLEARRLVQGDESRRVLASADGKLLYAEAVCYSPPGELDATDARNAANFVDVARDQMWRDWMPFSPRLVRVWWRCRKLHQQMTRRSEMRFVSEAAGKLRYVGVRRECDRSVSPWQVAENRSQSAHRMTWTPIPGEVEGARPDEAFIERVRREHRSSDSQRKVAVCAPFVAVGPAPESVCAAATRFSAHFTQAYGAQPPTAFIVLHHYLNREQLDRHVRERGGPHCNGGFLGYYDYRDQSVVFSAPRGFFGTLQHELTHALLFWDAPLMPPWFDEGLASLYEHTDADYVAKPNPWRIRLLRQRHEIDPIRGFIDETIATSTRTFLQDRLHHARARRAMMKLQQDGTLDELYEKLRILADNAQPAPRQNGAPEAKSWHSQSGALIARYRALYADPRGTVVVAKVEPPKVGVVRPREAAEEKTRPASKGTAQGRTGCASCTLIHGARPPSVVGLPLILWLLRLRRRTACGSTVHSR